VKVRQFAQDLARPLVLGFGRLDDDIHDLIATLILS
jgi:hypothetical protein